MVEHRAPEDDFRSERVAAGKVAAARGDVMNSEGSPSEIVAAGYTWTPGTELAENNSAFAKGASA